MTETFIFGILGPQWSSTSYFIWPLKIKYFILSFTDEYSVDANKILIPVSMMSLFFLQPFFSPYKVSSMRF